MRMRLKPKGCTSQCLITPNCCIDGKQTPNLPNFHFSSATATTVTSFIFSLRSHHHFTPYLHCLSQSVEPFFIIIIIIIMRATCCLHLPPPTSNPSSNTRPLTQLPLVRDEGCCWRRQCLLMRMASALIGLHAGNLIAAAENEAALALPLPLPVVATSDGKAAAKWSEKRICPSWRHNSLETVVPENLPRPAARRRYESVRSSNSKIVPPLSASAQIKTGCFSH